MKTKLMIGLLFMGSALFAETHLSIGIGVGGYGYPPPPVVAYAPPPVVAYAPPCPGPGYTWTDGYWYQAGPRRAWHAGYWSPPVYGRTYRVAPQHEANRYYDNRSGHDSRYGGNGYSNGYQGNGYQPGYNGSQYENRSGRR